MNKVLIDTHTFLWYMEGDKQLSEVALNTIQKTSFVALSIISLWEIAIKQNIGKLELIYSLEEYSRNWKAIEGEILILTEKHVFEYKNLALHHRDPFDRMLIAQAITENIPIISADTKFDLYPEIQRIW